MKNLLGLPILAFAIATMGCAKGTVFQQGGDEEKPTSLIAGTSLSRDNAARKPVYVAKFKVSVDAENGMNLCKGDATLTIYTDMATKPSGTLECVMIGSQDLGAMLDDGAAKEPMDPTKYPEAGRVQRGPNPMPGAAGAYFTPPRPFILGPVVQNVEEFKNFRFTEQSAVTFSGPQGVIQDTGAFTFDVVEHSLQFTAPLLGKTYDQVIHWESRASGFQVVPRKDAGIFDRWEWWWNPRPIAIVKMVIHTRISKLVGGSTPIGGIGDAFLGPVKITWDVYEESRY